MPKQTAPKVLSETILPMSDAPSHFPEHGEKEPCRNSVVRWSQQGRNGAVLETAKLGYKLVTSEEAIERFKKASGYVTTSAPTVKPLRKARAKRALRAAGV